MWNATNLENLARTYWLFLSRVTGGRSASSTARTSGRWCSLGRPLTLLRFDAPEYELERDHGNVTLANPRRPAGRARRPGLRLPSLDVSHLGDEPDGRVKLRIEVEVANFYPAIAVGFSTPVYEATQSAIHVLVTHAFLRSLAKLDLAPIEGRPLRRRPRRGRRRRTRRDRARTPHPRSRAALIWAPRVRAPQ